MGGAWLVGIVGNGGFSEACKRKSKGSGFKFTAGRRIRPQPQNDSPDFSSWLGSYQLLVELRPCINLRKVIIVYVPEAFICTKWRKPVNPEPPAPAACELSGCALAETPKP